MEDTTDHELAKNVDGPHHRNLWKRKIVEVKWMGAMKSLPILIVLWFLTGCASQIMQSYVGKDVREVMLDYGPPANAFDMGDGRRAFQWITNSSYTTPAYATTTGTATNYGYSSWVTTNTQIHGGQTINSSCIYTLFARWNEAREGWTIVDFKKPKFMCE